MDQRSVSVVSQEYDENPVSIVELVLDQHKLDEIAVHRAIGRRLAEAGMNQPVDKVMRDARAGEPWALDLVQTIDLPAPVAKLSMPVQEFGPNGTRGWIETLVGRWSPGRRRHA